MIPYKRLLLAIFFGYHVKMTKACFLYNENPLSILMINSIFFRNLLVGERRSINYQLCNFRMMSAYFLSYLQLSYSRLARILAVWKSRTQSSKDFYVTRSYRTLTSASEYDHLYSSGIKHCYRKYLSMLTGYHQITIYTLEASFDKSMIYKSLPISQRIALLSELTAVNGHLHYVFKFGIVTNGLGIIRRISFITNFMAHLISLSKRIRF